jgi:xanthine dehydrogenase accessory factor
MVPVVAGNLCAVRGCGELRDAAVEPAAEARATGERERRTFHHPEGDGEVFLVPRATPPRLVIVSATDVARSLREEMTRQGRDVVLVEPRSERLAPGDGPVAAFDRLDLGRDDEVVFTDHDAPDIADQLEAVLRSPVAFVGVMGSRRHVGRYVEELRRRGFGDEELARIRSPLGLDLGGRRPEEIALSIAAGLVAARHDGGGGWLDR